MMVHGFGSFRYPVHEFHGLDEACELEDTLDSVAVRPPAWELWQGLLNLGVGQNCAHHEFLGSNKTYLPIIVV
jgi:hypothetical protein